jgi:hypothetical protein
VFKGSGFRVYDKVGNSRKSREMSPSSLALLVMEETGVLSYMVVDLVVFVVDSYAAWLYRDRYNGWTKAIARAVCVVAHARARTQGCPNRAESRSRASRFDDSAKLSASAIRRVGDSAAMAM